MIVERDYDQQLKVWATCLLHTSRMSAVHGSFYGESKSGRMVDALAHGGDEGRDKLR